MLTGTRRDKVKCLWYKNVGQELVEIKWNVYDIRMSIDFRLKLEKSFYSHPFFQNIYLSIIGSIRNGKSFYLLFENIHPLWYHSLQHDIKKLLFDTLKLLFKLFAWVFLEKQTLKLTLIIVNLESHAIDKKWKVEHPPSPCHPTPSESGQRKEKLTDTFIFSFLSQNVHYNLLHFLWKKFWNLPGLYLQATESNL